MIFVREEVVFVLHENQVFRELANDGLVLDSSPVCLADKAEIEIVRITRVLLTLDFHWVAEDFLVQDISAKKALYNTKPKRWTKGDSSTYTVKIHRCNCGFGIM